MVFSHLPFIVFWALVASCLLILSLGTLLMGFPLFLAKGALFRCKRHILLFQGHRVVPFGFTPGFTPGW